MRFQCNSETWHQIIILLIICGCSSVVECLLAKEKVTGANPVTRSIARSSNGRIAAFEAVNDGSNPSLAARIGHKATAVSRFA